MNPILVQQMADHRMNALNREADAARLVAIARESADRAPTAGPTARFGELLRLVRRVALA